MSDPSRLSEGSASDPFERALLRSAAFDREPEDGAMRALAALGIASAPVVAGTAETSTTAHGLGAAGTSLATKIGAIVLAMGVVVVGTVALTSSDGKPPSTDAPSTSPAPRATAASDSVSTASGEVPGPELRAVSVAELPPAPSALSAPVRPHRVDDHRATPLASKAGSSKPSLAEELAMIDEARQAMTAGETTRAERALDAYDARFGHGTLVLEAKLARIELHIARSEREKARELCDRFLREHPQTAYDRRVRALLRRTRTEPTIVQ